VFDMVERPPFPEPNSSIANTGTHASSSQTRSWNRSRSFTAASAAARHAYTARVEKTRHLPMTNPITRLHKVRRLVLQSAS
jgi:hypothetical protein